MTVGARGWTLETLQEHWESIYQLNDKFLAERDRRYSEVNIEREKALKIKEEADKAALGLAREIQSYKDEKANQLREQITSERGSFATKDDLQATMREINAAIQPLSTYVASMAGQTKQSATSFATVVAIFATGASVAAIIGVVVTIVRYGPK